MNIHLFNTKKIFLILIIFIPVLCSCSQGNTGINPKGPLPNHNQTHKCQGKGCKCQGKGCNTEVNDKSLLDSEGYCSTCSKPAVCTRPGCGSKVNTPKVGKGYKNLKGYCKKCLEESKIKDLTPIDKSKFDQTKGVTIKKGYKINNKKNSSIYICEGSVVKFKGDAIVNAANQACLGGGGVDGAISTAGGTPLYNERYKLPILTDAKRCLTGSAVVTLSGKGKTVNTKNKEPYRNTKYQTRSTLECDYVIHAVGPNRNSVGSSKKFYELLNNTYIAAISRASEVNAKSVAFSLISSSIFRGKESLYDVLQASLKSVIDNAGDDMKIYMVAYSDVEINTLNKITNDLIQTN